jgi:hypothetical protein
MRIDLTASSILVDGQGLPARMNAAEFVAIFGNPVRSRDIKMHPSGIRRAQVNSCGIVWYLDEPEDVVSHFHLAVSPADTPEKPAHAFAGPIFFGGLALDAETTQAALKRQKDIGFQIRPHQCWYDSTHHNITLSFERRRSSTGKRSKTARLASVSISFHANRTPLETPADVSPRIDDEQFRRLS